MGRFIEEEDDDDFDGDSFEDNTDDFDSGTEEVVADSATDERSRMRQYTERRRRIEDLIEEARLRDELGMYDDDFSDFSNRLH